jgi:hypothetical protein
VDNQLQASITVYPIQDTSMDINGTGRTYYRIDVIEIEYTVFNRPLEAYGRPIVNQPSSVVSARFPQMLYAAKLYLFVKVRRSNA